MEMMNILGDFMDGLGQRPRSYLHLVPSTTTEDAKEILFGADEADDFGTDDFGTWSWADYAMDKARGCHQRMQGLKEWYFGGDADPVEMMPYSTFSTTKEVEIVFEIGEYEDDAEDGQDMYFGIASMASMVLMVFGMCYSCYRFRMARLQQMKRYDLKDYIVMHETDEFQGE